MVRGHLNPPSPSVTRNGTKGASIFGSIRSTASQISESLYSPDFDEESIPDDDEVQRRFSMLVEKMTLPPERESELNKSSKENKWKLVKAKEHMQPKYSCDFYVDQLRRHMLPVMRQKNPPRKSLKGLEPIYMILRSLEVDLRTNPNTTWLREFLDEPHLGADLLIQVLQHLHTYPPPSESNLVPTKKKPHVKDPFSRFYLDEHLCLMCLRALMKNKYGFTSVMQVEDCTSAIVLCLKISNIKTQALTIKLLLLACSVSEYHSKVIDAWEYYKNLMRESTRFSTLVRLTSTQPNFPQFQALCLALINAVVSNAPALNHRIFHQQELENAGFDPETVELTLEGVEAPDVREELKQWRSNYIDVQTIMDDYVTLRNRSTLLRDEVDLLQLRLEECQREKNDMTRKKEEFERLSEDNAFKITELKTALEDMVRMYKNESRRSSNESSEYKVEVAEEMLKPSSPPPGIPPPPPPPPPPGAPLPPPPPSMGGTMSRTLQRVPTVKLPLLNWNPITNEKQQSIFKIDRQDEILQQIDFSSFEKNFQLQTNEMSEEIKQKKAAALKKLAQKITVIDTNRARNMVIAKRRIGHTPEKIRVFVNNTDLVEIPAENVELLLKFIPTKDELKGLAKYAEQYEELAEAEQFMFQIAKIERYETKLNVMAFIGMFDELINSIIPQIDAVWRAATSIMNSKKLQQLFEIILAVGNYINCQRKGIAYGFKLDSLYALQDTRSANRKTSLLQYIVQTTKETFPDVHSFSEDLHLKEAIAVSKQSLAADVHSLRKGLDLAKSEKDKQSWNFVIYSFYKRSFRKVQRVTERFRKMDEAYKQVCEMFGENPRTKEPSEFFGIFNDFVNMYQAADNELDSSKRQANTELQAKKALLRQSKLRHPNMPNMSSIAHEAAAAAWKMRRTDSIELYNIPFEVDDPSENSSENGSDSLTESSSASGTIASSIPDAPARKVVSVVQ